ncbi:MAG: hypothetical protein ACYSYV_02790 [Planctomycetota bacterium]|jgi:predicted dehydrogenase
MNDKPQVCIVGSGMITQVHYEVIQAALACDQHVCCVKPLVLAYSQLAGQGNSFARVA